MDVCDDVDVVIEAAMIAGAFGREEGSQGLPGVAIVVSEPSCGVVFSYALALPHIPGF
jgi:hypothetical protein